MSQENVAVVRRWIDACNQGDFDAALTLVHSDFVMTDAGRMSSRFTTVDSRARTASTTAPKPSRPSGWQSGRPQGGPL